MEAGREEEEEEEEGWIWNFLFEDSQYYFESGEGISKNNLESQQSHNGQEVQV